MKARTISSVGLDPSSKYMSTWLIPAWRKNSRSYLPISSRCSSIMGAYKSLFSLTTTPTFSSLNTFMTHRNPRFGYLLFGLFRAIACSVARALRFAGVGFFLANSAMTQSLSTGEANGTNGPRTLRSPFLLVSLDITFYGS